MATTSIPMCTCGGSARYAQGHYPDCPSIAASLTKLTHGPCTCTEVRLATTGHLGDCPSLYPAQQDPDILTRLARIVRMMQAEQLQRRTDMLAEEALALISEVREEQRKARDRGWNDGLEEAARWLKVVLDQPTMAAEVRAKKVTP